MEQLYFDTHAHYDDKRFSVDRETLINALPGAGVRYVLNPGCNLKSSEQALKLTREYPFFYAAAGFHPHDTGRANLRDLDRIAEIAKQEKVLAVGEIGLDYHYDFSPRETQKIFFRHQMEIASELDLPVIIHDREAHADCLEIVSDYPEVRCLFHCYTGSLEHAKRLLKLGCFLSFTGAVTFKNAYRAAEVVAYLPSDRFMIETDAPYMAPEPMRGKRCDSSLLPCTAKRIAEIRGVSEEEIARQTLENGMAFFGIKE